ncbi:hypothetical protein Rs2_52701 [Raphanus sativus]|nr:hypothetical protein Rs2_52701 [Raphanus sativus]
MTRQLICEVDHTFWTVFGSDPFKFGLEEFGDITGLNCGSLPEGYEAPDHNEKGANKQENAHTDPFWQRLIGKDNNITIADLADQLEHDEEMDDWRRIRLALIIIVDGVLVASTQVHRPTLRYVQMLEDLDSFLEFPWGRESFLHTVRSLKPPKFFKGKPVDDPVALLVSKLKQKTFRLTGFPLALQLLAFRAIPMLLSKWPAPSQVQTIMDVTERDLPAQNTLDTNDILLVEDNQQMVVSSITPVSRGQQPGWGVWPFEKTDEKVEYMEQLISINHNFTKTMWPGGDRSETLRVVPEEKGPAEEGIEEQVPVHKKHVVQIKRKRSNLQPRQPSTNPGSATKRRRTSRVSSASTSNTDTNKDVEDRLSVLEARVTNLEKANQSLKESRRRRRRGSRAPPNFPNFALNHRRRLHRGTVHNSEQANRDGDAEKLPIPQVKENYLFSYHR